MTLSTHALLDSPAYLGSLPNGDLVFCAHFKEEMEAQEVQLWSIPDTGKLGQVQLGRALAGQSTVISVQDQLCAVFSSLFLLDGKYNVRLVTKAGVQTDIEVAFKKKLNSDTPTGVRSLASVSNAWLKFLSTRTSASPEPVSKPVEISPSLDASQLPQASTSTSSPKISKAEPDSQFAFAGSIDGFVDTRIDGWLWNVADPDARYELQAWCEGNLVAYGVADKYRADLENKRKGDGRVKFELPLSSAIFDGKPHAIQLMVVVDPDTRRLVSFGPPLTFVSKAVALRKTPAIFSRHISALRNLQSVVLGANLQDRRVAIYKELLFKLAMHLHNDQFENAYECIRSVQSKVGAGVLLELFTALVHESCDKNLLALTAFEPVCKELPPSQWLLTTYGDLLHKTGKWFESLQSYRQARDLSPQPSDELNKKINDLQLKTASALTDQSSAQVNRKSLLQLIASNPEDRELTRQLFEADQRTAGPKAKLALNVGSDCAELRHQRLVLESKVELLLAGKQ